VPRLAWVTASLLIPGKIPGKIPAGSPKVPGSDVG
jgi:hypothetical protein